jgi:hypothetical protein
MTMSLKTTCLVGAFALVTVGPLAAQQMAQEVKIVTAAGGAPMVGGKPDAPMAIGTGLIFGQAVEADSNRPVPGALVTLMLPGATPIRVLSDGQGRFAFRDLPQGRFTVSVMKAGWADGAYGRTRPNGPSQPIPLKEGERVSGIALPMWRFAAIQGSVLDQTGEPIVNAPVRILRRSLVGGQWRLVPAQMDMTDDRGIYRVGYLEPGDYIVAVPMQQNGVMPMELPVDLPAAAGRNVMLRVEAASVSASSGAFFSAVSTGAEGAAGMSEDGHPLVYPSLFYPSATSAARAAIVSVGTGEERTGIDFQMKPVRAVRVAGIATGPSGPAANLQVNLLPADSDELVSSLEVLTAFTDATGQFTFDAVPPGQYTLRTVQMPRAPMPANVDQTVIQQGGAIMVTRMAIASDQAPLPADPTLWAELPVGVGEKDIADLAVGLRPGIKISGSLQFDGGAQRPTSEQLTSSVGVFLEPADTRPGVNAARGRVESSGQFATMGVPPGRYLLRVKAGLQGWNFRAAMVNGRDISDTPIELESGDVAGVILSFSDRTSELAGQVTVDGDSTEPTTVMAFPTDPTAWVGYGTVSKRLATTRADANGNFSLQGLPTGEYYVVAVPDKSAGDWPNPTYLETLSSVATRVRIRDGEKVTQALKVVR